MPRLSPDLLDSALYLLAEEMLAKTIPRHQIVVCGGAALLALKFSLRTTKDVDIIARLDDRMSLAEPKPLSPALVEAANKVGQFLKLPKDWLNTGPSDQLKAGLPEGFVERLIGKEFGSALQVYYTSRYDLIHLKLFALVDQGPGKHSQDLRALNPTQDELLAAARWVLSQDAGPDFIILLRTTLWEIGQDAIADQI